MNNQLRTVSLGSYFWACLVLLVPPQEDQKIGDELHLDSS